MQTLTQIKSQLELFKPKLKQKYPIKDLAIFGSYARGEANEKSDLDLMVEFSKPVGYQFFELAQELENYLDIKVDLVSKKGIKPAYFESLKADLIHV